MMMDGGTFIGEAVIDSFSSREPAHLRHVWLRRSSRGYGYGTRLLRCATRWLDKVDCACLLNVYGYDGRMGLKEDVLFEWYSEHGWRPYSRSDFHNMRRPSLSQRQKQRNKKHS